jgi:hypothetical protein
MSKEKQAENDLLLRGTGSYLNALAAIEAFRQEVETTCRGAYLRHEAELLKAMGLDAEECERWEDSYPEEWSAELGICRSAQKGANCFYIYLSWSEARDGTPLVEATACLDFTTLKRRDEVFQSLHRSAGCPVERVGGEYYNLLLKAQVELNGLRGLSDILDQLVLKWIGYCEAIGGLKLKKYQAS